MARGRFILSSEQFLRKRSQRKSQRRSSAPTSKTRRERSGRTSRTWGKRSTGSQKIWSRSTTIWEQMSLMISGMYNCTKYPIQQRTIYSVHGPCRQNYFLNISVQTDGNGRRSQSLPRCRRRQIRETVRKSEDFLIFRWFILSPGKGPWRWRKSTKHWYQRRTPKNDLRYGQSHRTLGGRNKVKLTNINCLSIFLNRAEIKEEVKRITPMDVYMKVIFSLLPPLFIFFEYAEQEQGAVYFKEMSLSCFRKGLMPCHFPTWKPGKWCSSTFPLHSSWFLFNSAREGQGRNGLSQKGLLQKVPTTSFH